MVLAGEDILASDIWTPRYIAKNSAETVTSSIVPQNDDDFVVALPVGIWRVTVQLFVTGVSSTTLGGIRVNWTTTGTMSSLGRMCRGPGFGSTDMSTSVGASTFRASAHGLGTNIGYGAIGGSTAVVEEDLLLNVTVAGTLQLQWAQQVSSGTGTAVNSGSRMFIVQHEAY